ncbi:hypothetical protein HYH02_004191 [Chlamydomonas schloesseri]|uniref:SRCR domain-containing protein n=1 Tax=Chlamydomonas schloesseri TaxID=2026947 RepID=A0A836B9A0_9CHLO|nr:hypothetical protein HYH02_004191 [Chlamydomonas schloesseri]|eukprot:KAG2451596.1 hypothetical protein HYH02_004191 [Chlamydomonas schloesseri]
MKNSVCGAATVACLYMACLLMMHPIHAAQPLPPGTQFRIILGGPPADRYGDYRGRAEVNLPDGRRGSVCARGWDTQLSTGVCNRWNSYWKYGIPVNGSAFGPPAQISPVVLADISCSGGQRLAAFLDVPTVSANVSCTATVYDSAAAAAADGCGLDQAAGVNCFMYDYLTPPGSPPLPLRLVSSGNQTALDAAAQAGLVAAGRLEVQWGGVWGGVCSNAGSGTQAWWDDRYAQVVCRQLGYPADGHAYAVGTRNALLPGPPPADQPQFITFAQCNGSEPGLGVCRGYPINGSLAACSSPDYAVHVACYSQKLSGWLTDLRCPAGDEVNIKACLGTFYGNAAEAATAGCDNTTVAGVRCFAYDFLTPPGSPPLPLRLVSSGNQTALGAAARAGLVAAGRLEVQWGGVWGGVCSTSMSSFYNWWQDTHAQVICRQLGYVDGHAYKAGTLSPLLPGPVNQANYWITYAQCNGSEPGLGACRGLPINSSTVRCTADNAVHVACYSQKRLAASFGPGYIVMQTANSSAPQYGYRYGEIQGRPEVKLYSSNRIVGLCDWGWDATAASSWCRVSTSLSYAPTPYGMPYTGSYFGSSSPSATAWLADLRCPTGDETDLGACLGTFYNSSADAAAAGCTAATNAGVQCFASSFLTPPGSPPPPLRLVSSGNQTALDAAARAGLVAAGRLEVQWGGVWGGVCSNPKTWTLDWWRDQHAQVVCRQLGYADGHAFAAGVQNALLPDSSPTGQPQYITYLQCNGSEPNIGGCRGPPVNSSTAACGPEYAVHVACYSQKRLQGLLGGPVQGFGQFGNGSSPSDNYGTAQGRPEIRLRDGRMVATCDRGFDDTAATTACRFMTVGGSYGWPYGMSYTGSYFGSVPYATAWLADLRCPAGDESVLGYCLGTVYNSSAEAAAAGCTAATVAGVRCFSYDYLTPPGSPPPPLRLVSSGNQTALDAAARAGLVAAGRVEVQWGGVWGGVCSTSMSSFYNWWQDTHAQVICRQLGYVDGHAYKAGTLSPLLPGPVNQANYWITYAQCNGSEPGLGACRGLPINSSTVRCMADNAVHVACYSQKRLFKQFIEAANLTGATPARYQLGTNMINTRDPPYGYGFSEGQPLLVFPNGRQLSLCDRNWDDAAATAFCRAKYYSIQTRMYGQALPGSSFRPDLTRPGALLADLRCPAGDETDLVMCLGTLYGSGAAAAVDGCTADHVAGARCFKFDYIYPPGRAPPLPTRLVELNTSYSGGSGTAEQQPQLVMGRVEVQWAGMWGGACSSRNYSPNQAWWNNATARVACRAAGYWGGAAYQPRYPDQLLPPGVADAAQQRLLQPQWLRYAQCSGEEASFGACRGPPLNSTGNDGGDPNTACTGADAVFAICSLTPPVGVRVRPPSPPPPTPTPQAPSLPPAASAVGPDGGGSAVAMPPPPQPPLPSGEVLLNSTGGLFATSAAEDYPELVSDVPQALPNLYPAATLALLGPSLPLLLSPQQQVVAAATRYGSGRAAVFGAEKMVTRCCSGVNGSSSNSGSSNGSSSGSRNGSSTGSINGSSSDPAMDRLLVNVVRWAATAGGGRRNRSSSSGSGSGGLLCVSRPDFSAAAAYVVSQAPGMFGTGSNGSSGWLEVPLWAFARPLAAALLDTNDTGTGGTLALPPRPYNCSVYVIGTHDALYLQPYMQRRLVSYVAGGGGLVVAGPDLLPSALYGGADGNDSAGDAGAGSQRRRLQQQSGAGGMGTAGDGGGSGSASQPQIPLGSLEVNAVTGPLGIVLTGFVSDPGGNLTLASPSLAHNAELAAAQLVGYLQGRLPLSPPDLQLLLTTTTRTRAVLSGLSTGGGGSSGSGGGSTMDAVAMAFERFQSLTRQVDGLVAAAPAALLAISSGRSRVATHRRPPPRMVVVSGDVAEEMLSRQQHNSNSQPHQQHQAGGGGGGGRRAR